MPSQRKDKKGKMIFNPRQLLFITLYFDPSSETFGNALQSALKAGYSKDYSECITGMELEWLAEASKDMNIVSKAEKNLSHFLDLDEDSDSKLRVKSENTRFALERLNKKKYSSKTETDITSNGERIEAINYIVPKKPESRE
jgi:hypothetical protein